MGRVAHSIPGSAATKSDRRLWCCVALVAALHAGLFQWLNDAGSTAAALSNGSGAKSLQFRALRVNHLAVAPTGRPELLRIEIGTSEPASAHAVADSKTAEPAASDAAPSLNWSHRVSVSAPDAVLPDEGKSLRLRLWLELDPRGEILALQASDPRPQTQAFVDAVAEGIGNAGLSAADGLGPAASTRLCLTAQFHDRAPVQLEVERLSPDLDQRKRCLGR